MSLILCQTVSVKNVVWTRDNMKSIIERKRSTVWRWFRIVISLVDGVMQSVLDYCGKKTVSKNAGSNNVLYPPK